jgi:hypothetical protein
LSWCRASYSYTPGVATGYDDFTGTTAGVALNARVAPAGGTWATSGAATDFVFSDPTGVPGSVAYSEAVTRSTLNDAGRRFAILGTAVFTDTEIASTTAISSPREVSSWDAGVIARWVDSSNYLAAYIRYNDLASPAVNTGSFEVEQIVAGVTTSLASIPLINGTYGTANLKTRLIVYASGTFYAQLLAFNTGTEIVAAAGSSAALATGGALDDGKPGLLDRAINTSAVTAATRYYDDFQVATPKPEPIALYGGQSIEFRHDDVIREDSGGTVYGRPPSYRGSRFVVPVGTSRVLAKARRNDVETSDDPNVTDATQLQVGVTPRGLVVPRA